MRALVVFRDNGGHVLDLLLKRGFRHVFCAIQDPKGYWIRFDNLEGLPQIDIVGVPGTDLATFWRAEGFTVIEMERGNEAPRWPLVNANCVGAVKVMLGIRAPFVLTPRQLYKRLKP